MDLREEVFSHQEKLWIICLGEEDAKKALPPLFDMVDWYNNQILTKTILTGKLDLSFGSKTIIGTVGILPVNKILLFGLGTHSERLDGKTILTELHQTLVALDERDPWILVPPKISEDLISQLNKGRTQWKTLAGSSVSV